MKVFIVKPRRPQEYRTKFYHCCVFHGYARRRAVQRTPSILTGMTDPLMVKRSGVFVPPVWMPRELILNDRIKRRMEGLQNTAFLQVQFEKLVDIRQPRIGDFSWYNRQFGSADEADPAFEIDTKPDLPDRHEAVGAFWEVVAANIYDLDALPTDATEIRPDFGSYGTQSVPPLVLVSESFSREYPVVWGGKFQFRSDAFRVIARFLDPNYFDIATHNFDTGPPLGLD